MDIIRFRESDDEIVIQAKNLKCRLSEMRRDIESPRSQTKCINV
jgi:hypothetical protein